MIPKCFTAMHRKHVILWDSPSSRPCRPLRVFQFFCVPSFSQLPGIPAVWLPAANAAIIISACTKLSQQGLLKHVDFCVCTTYKVGCQSPWEMTRRGDLLKHKAATTIHPASTASSHPAPPCCFSFSLVPSQEAGSLMAHQWLAACPVSSYRGQRVGGGFTLSQNHAPRQVTRFNISTLHPSLFCPL